MFHVKHMAPDPFVHLAQELAELEREGLRRRPGQPAPPDQISFCSNDYLDLASCPAPPIQAGAGASRLIAGQHGEHVALERALSAWLGCESALLFTSGYAANVGTLAALARPGDLIVSDALNHASLVDGARLSRARVAVVPHNDTAAIRDALAQRHEARAWVVVESYYSMDADGPDLGTLRTICDAQGAALYVDEAHALGVLGPSGRGRAAEAGITPDVFIGTLGKALGGQGAFAAGRQVLCDWLWNRARSFVFSTGLAPVSAAAAQRALTTVLQHPERAARVRAMAARLRAGLIASGATPGVLGRSPDLETPLLLGAGHIVPVVLGSPTRALAVAERLRARGVIAHAVRPPTVPSGTSRIRLTVTARHEAEHIDRAVEAFAWAIRPQTP